MKAKVIDNTVINSLYGFCVLSPEDLVLGKNAGRFFMISPIANGKCREISDPLLNRPFAIANIYDDGSFLFIYQIVGKGTNIISRLKAGDTVDIIAPLGNYFNLVKNSNVALIAGGVGVSPLIYLGKLLRDQGCTVSIFYGGRSEANILPLDLLSGAYDNISISTEDGSVGNKGFVTESIISDIAKFDYFYSAGPTGMLYAITKLAIDNNIPISVSLESHMGCGIGACLGCLVPMLDNQFAKEQRCCISGPVFDGKIIDWDRLLKR